METLNNPLKSKFNPFSHMRRSAAPHVVLPRLDLNITPNITHSFSSKKVETSREIPPLGIRTKSASPSRDEVTVARFRLQSAAARLMPSHRVAKCLRDLATKKHERMFTGPKGMVDLMYSAASDSAHFKGLQLCGSVWDCPVCAAKITELRRQELAKAMHRAKELGYSRVMTTYTQRHLKHQRCKDLLQQFNKSRRRFKSGKGWQTIAAKFGYIGSTSGKEPTHTSEHGWHIHTHELMVFDHLLTADEVQQLELALKARWVKVADADWKHGLDVQAGHEATENYVSKFGLEPQKSGWTLEHEVTKSHTKKASRNGRTPFQLLDAADAGDSAAGELFREYSAAFKGQRQLVWTRGLRAMLGLDEVEQTDEELAELEQAEAVVVASLTARQWRVVVGNDCRAELIGVIKSSRGNQNEVWLWLGGLGIEP